MNRAIRHTWVVSVALFLSLFVALSLIQVVLSNDLNSHPQNARETIANAGAPRGPITVEGSPIAESVPSEHSQYDYQRVYNDPELYSGITGFFSVVEGSPSGLEQSLSDYLSGQSDAQFFDRITSLFTAQTMQGAQVELTLDAELQRQAYDMIPEDQRGTIIVTDVTTGEVRAMVAKPSYDTNLLAVHSGSQFQENMEQVQGIEGLSPYRSRALNVPIAPGSTFKLIDALAMLESGDYDLDTELDNPDQIELPQSTNVLSNLETGSCGQRSQADFAWIFAQSCNTPFAEAAMDLGEDSILEAAEAFGWNDSDVNIPLNLTASVFPEMGSEAELALSAIGQQSVTATAMQMNMAAAAIANDGEMMQPQLVDTIRGSDLQILEQPSPEVLNDVMDSSTADDMTEMMVGTVEEGTGWRAQSSRFDVAAKTGTAERWDEAGEDAGTVNSWITGFAPADDPQYAVTVVYEGIDMGTGSELVGSQMLTMLEAVIEE